jgi:hypothetical protein
VSDPALFDLDDRPPHQRSAWESFSNRVGKVRHDHPDTSYEAARLVAPKSGTARQRVLAVIAKSDAIGGITDEGIQQALSMNPSTERPRRVELVEEGWVADSGERVRARDGRATMIPWILTDQARAAL